MTERQGIYLTGDLELMDVPERMAYVTLSHADITDAEQLMNAFSQASDGLPACDVWTALAWMVLNMADSATAAMRTTPGGENTARDAVLEHFHRLVQLVDKEIVQRDSDHPTH